MRMTSEHYAMLHDIIHPLDTIGARTVYMARSIPRGDLVTDIDKRYRWDLFWAAFNAPNMDLRAILATGGYEDTHIYTALRKIVPALG